MANHEKHYAKDELAGILTNWIAKTIQGLVVEEDAYVAGQNIRRPASGVWLVGEGNAPAVTLNPDMWHPHRTGAQFQVHYGLEGFHFSSQKEESKLIRKTLRELLGREYVTKEKPGFTMTIPFDEATMDKLKERILSDKDFPHSKRALALIGTIKGSEKYRPPGGGGGRSF